MHNCGAPSSVAIRWESEIVNREEQWIRAEGLTHDEAGASAALLFADRLRARGRQLIEWSERIESALAAEKK
jgi:hypothetical protein